MTRKSPRVYASAAAVAAALALSAMLADPAWSPRGTARAQQSQAARAPSAQQKAAPSLLVLNKADNALAVVDPSTMTVSGAVETGKAPDGLAWVGE